MAVTYNSGKLLNPLSSAVTGGTIPEANVIIDVAHWADALEPRRTPILTQCQKGGNVEQMKHEWGQSYHAPVSGTIAEALDTSETHVDLASGEGKYIQAWHVIGIANFVSGTTRVDYSNWEEIVVRTVDGTDTLPAVQRGAGGTTAAAHDSGAHWEIIGVALPHNTDFQLSPFVRGDRLYNHPQRFYRMSGADEAARRTPTYEHPGDQLLADVEADTLLNKWYLERAIVAGGRQAGDANGTPTTTTQNPYKMGGIDYFITNHSGRVTNMSGKTLSAYDLEDIMADIFTEIDDGGAKTLIMSINTARIFDTMLNPIRQATTTDTGISLMVDTIKFRWGEVQIQPTRHLRDGSILFVDFKDIFVLPYDGMTWKQKVIATKGPYDQIANYGEYTLEVRRVTRMAKLHNFNTDLTAYPRREWF